MSASASGTRGTNDSITSPAIFIRSTGQADVVSVGPDNSLDCFTATPGSAWRAARIAGPMTTFSSPSIYVDASGKAYVAAITKGINGFWSSNATTAGVKLVAGDFDGDGRTDIAMMGGAAWNTIPIAFSNGDGSFRITNSINGNWATLATGAVKVVSATSWQ